VAITSLYGASGWELDFTCLSSLVSMGTQNRMVNRLRSASPSLAMHACGSDVTPTSNTLSSGKRAAACVHTPTQVYNTTPLLVAT